ncbi:MAG: trypsin-like peptidase domain-containing protein [Roseobacter sp.]
MAEHFLTKTRIDLGRCIDVGGGSAVERYADLYSILTQKAGPDVAKLFAEPLVSKGNDQAASTVSWYSDRPGQGVPFAKLDAAGQEEVGAILGQRLEVIQSFLDDPESGALLSAALYIGGSGDIWSVEGQPVLVNWGLMPEAGSDVTTRQAHFAATLGPFLASQTPPPLTDGEHEERRVNKTAAVAAAATVAAAAAASTAAAETPAVQAAANTTVKPALTGSGGGGDGTPPVTPIDPAPRRRVPLVAWVPLILLLLLFGGALAWLLVPGNRIFTDDGPQPAIADADTLLAAREINRALEQRLGDLNQALEGSVCRADGTLLMPDGLTIEGLLPPDFEQGRQQGGEVIKGDATPTLPPAPERVLVPPADGQFTDTAGLLQHIDARTAMVLVGTQNGMSAGTGFFVGPDLMVTNFHVIENAREGGLFVTNKSMGGLKQAQLLKSFGPMREVGADFALLRVEGVDQPFYTVRQSDASMRLQSVITAGYPSDVLSTDSQFQALRDGDASAVPGLTVTDGTVNAEQNLSPTTNAVIHSAPISKGNSGGPLIDMCGRVVGVNTFVVQGPLRNLNFALATPDLLSFLSDTEAAPLVSGDGCAPLVARPMPVPIATGQ